MDLLLNFVVKLPKCRHRNQTFQHILVIVNKFTKQCLYELLEILKTVEFINAMYRKIFAIYEFLLTTMNDKGGQIISKLWKWLCNRYGISIKFFSVYHPKTNS